MTATERTARARPGTSTGARARLGRAHFLRAAGVGVACSVLVACAATLAAPAPAPPAATAAATAVGPSQAVTHDPAVPPRERVADAAGSEREELLADSGAIGYIGLLNASGGEDDPNAPDAPWRHHKDAGADAAAKKDAGK